MDWVVNGKVFWSNDGKVRAAFRAALTLCSNYLVCKCTVLSWIGRRPLRADDLINLSGYFPSSVRNFAF
jgi:hypothetical protein